MHRRESLFPLGEGAGAIVANGGLSERERRLLNEGAYGLVICCDGVGKEILKGRLQGDLLVGDFDSLEPSVLEELRKRGLPIQIYPAEKDDTDMQLAIDIAMDRGFQRLDLFGATGGRMDHCLANIMLLYHILGRGGKGRLIDRCNLILAGEKQMDFSEEEVRRLLFEPEEKGILYVSLLLLDDCRGITLEGFRYPLKDFDGKAGETLCISNEFSEKRGRIFFEEGRLLVIFSKDRPAEGNQI